MSKKNTVKKAAALFLGLALTVGGAGCNFLVADTQKDLAQIVATVDITENLGKDEQYKAYADDVEKLINEGGLSTEIPKRDLVAYFMSVGYNYVNSYGYSYKDTFEMLMDTLSGNKILTQYAVAYFLKQGTAEGINADTCLAYVKAETEKATGTEKALLEAHPEVLTMKYFLTNGGKTTKEDLKEYNEAVYGLLKSINSSLDSAEASYIKTAASTHSHATTETRTTPTNANVQNEEYFPLKADNTLDYDVYTGRNNLNECGTYAEGRADGATASTRKKAYNAFLSNIKGYGLIKEGEDTVSFKELDYYYVELSSTLSMALVQKYYAELEDKAIEKLTANDYKYVADKYEEVYEGQERTYTQGTEAFTTALDGVSDDSFVLYGQEGFGFVYNILIPFSQTQTQEYAIAKNKNLTQEGLYNARAKILEKVEAKDLRGAWFCNDVEADDHYAYEKGGKYYFFENNFTNAGKDAKYKTLKQYAGEYAYDGTAVAPNLDDEDKTNDEWKLTPNKTKIVTNNVADGFIRVFENYVSEFSGASVEANGKNVHYGKYFQDEDGNAVDEVNYDAFIYYEGKVDVGAFKASDFFYDYDGNTAYKALSAVNELMFAYSTDPGCLNTYMGYAVSPYKTNFVPEFEYAAQQAVKAGVGAYNVVATDYGWHIIYCSFKYDTANVYGGFKKEDVEKEGTLSNLFYESLKGTAASNYTTEKQSKILNQYESSTTFHTERYEDLLELDK